jgi:hypothetical protein
MIKNLFTVFLFCGVLGLAAVPSLLAQPGQTKQEKKAAKVKNEIEKAAADHSRTVTVKLLNNSSAQAIRTR